MEIDFFSYQGDRESMQVCSFIASRSKIFFGGVFDGHGESGMEIAELAMGSIRSDLEFFTGQCGLTAKHVLEIVCDLASRQIFSHFSGTTALCFILREDGKLAVANTGDSRLVIVSGGAAWQVTDDHNTVNENEAKRVIKSGGVIFGNYIWNGDRGLMCIRSFGDRHFNESGVISTPEIFEPEVKSGDFIIAGTDGLWNEINNAEAAEIVSGKSTAKEAKEALANAICEIGEDNCDMDNITFIVLKI